MALEQQNAKVILQRLYTRADTRLRYPERIGSMTEVQIFGDSQCLDKRRKGNTRPE